MTPTTDHKRTSFSRRPSSVPVKSSDSRQSNPAFSSSIENESGLEKQIKLILSDIRDTEDPKVLNKYRKLFRKHIPLSSRAYFAAYLLKYGSFLNSPASKKKTRFKKLYWGAGKNHKITSKTIQDSLLKVDALQKTDIGTITIMQHYSFIEVNENFAETVISTFNDSLTEKKKRLAVNYAKKR